MSDICDQFDAILQAAKDSRSKGRNGKLEKKGT